MDSFDDYAFVGPDDGGVLVSLHAIFPRDGVDVRAYAILAVFDVLGPLGVS